MLILQSNLLAQAAADLPKDSTIIDRDGHQYLTRVMPDGKRWMTQNLNLTVAESWCYNNDTLNCQKFGRLYNWDSAQEACSLLGNDWQLPNEEDWLTLVKTQGGYLHFMTGRPHGDPKKAFEALQKGGESGFEALLGGWRLLIGEFIFKYQGQNGGYWSMTPFGYSLAIGMVFREEYIDVAYSMIERSTGLSVRCVEIK